MEFQEKCFWDLLTFTNSETLEGRFLWAMCWVLHVTTSNNRITTSLPWPRPRKHILARIYNRNILFVNLHIIVKTNYILVCLFVCTDRRSCICRSPHMPKRPHSSQPWDLASTILFLLYVIMGWVKMNLSNLGPLWKKKASINIELFPIIISNPAWSRG